MTWDALSPADRAACVDAGRLPDLGTYEDHDDYDDIEWDEPDSDDPRNFETYES